jgi:hypothetical protein
MAKKVLGENNVYILYITPDVYASVFFKLGDWSGIQSRSNFMACMLRVGRYNSVFNTMNTRSQN